MPRSEDNRAILGKIYSAFKSGNLELWRNYFNDESVLFEAESLPFGGKFKGLDSILTVMGTIGRVFGEFVYDVEEVYASGSSVIAYGTMSAVGKATGRRVNMPLVERWVIENGIVREVAAIYADTAELVRALTLPTSDKDPSGA